MSEFVVWFDSSETGAPVLNNAAGSMISVLDACLVTGFNTKSVTSITIAGGIATAACTAHGYSPAYSKDIRIEGATPAGLNGRKQITVVNANTFTFATAVTGTVTGTITARRDSAGWLKEYEDVGANSVVYKRTDVTASSIRLRVVDPIGSACRATSVENPTDANTFSQKAPAEGKFPGGLFWSKGLNNSSAKHWFLVADSKMFYLITQSGSNTRPFVSVGEACSGVMLFGDIITFKQGDAYNTVVAGQYNNDGGGGQGVYNGSLFGKGGSLPLEGLLEGLYYSRAYSQLGGPVLGTCAGFCRENSGGVNSFVFPSPVDSGYAVSTQILALEPVSNGATIRGRIPGVVEILGQFAIEHCEIVDTLVGFPGRKIVGVRTLAPGLARGAFDITGPWS